MAGQAQVHRLFKPTPNGILRLAIQVLPEALFQNKKPVGEE